MRGGILAFGIILLVIGLFFYFSGKDTIDHLERQAESVPFGELLQSLSEETQREYREAKQLTNFGTILAIVGMIICVAGLASKKEK